MSLLQPCHWHSCWPQEDWHANEAMLAELAALREDLAPAWLQASWFWVLLLLACFAGGSREQGSSKAVPSGTCGSVAAAAYAGCGTAGPPALPSFGAHSPHLSASCSAAHTPHRSRLLWRRQQNGMCGRRYAKRLWTCAAAAWARTWSALGSAATC